jgi:glycosyltransferase involved in cell wall biosynthesis
MEIYLEKKKIRNKISYFLFNNKGGIMKVIIISTVDNKELFLDGHIKSLLNQTYKNIEFIFVNDGSIDDSLKILKHYEKNDKRIIVIDQKNQGPSIARKNGFKKSTGEIIYFVDSDDQLYSGSVISDLVEIFAKNEEIDFVLGQMYNSFDSSDTIDKVIYSDDLTEGIYDINYMYDKSFRFSLCSNLMRRELLKEEDFADSRVYEDAIVTYSIYNRAKKFYYYGQPIYIVNRKSLNNKRTTNTLNIENLKEKYKNIKILENFSDFNVSIKRLKLQSYLDDLNYALRLRYGDKIKVIELAKSHFNKENHKKNYLIQNKHYKKIYKHEFFYSKPFWNLMISYFEFFSKKIKRFVKKILQVPKKIVLLITKMFLKLGQKKKLLFYKIKYGKRISIGKNISFRKNFIINISDKGHLKIGNNCFFNNYCTINCRNNIIIGNDNIFGENVKFYDHDHIFNDKEKDIKNNFSVGKISIGNNNWIGTNVVLLKNTLLENKNVIGAGVILNGKYGSNKLIKGDRTLLIEDITYKD